MKHALKFLVAGSVLSVFACAASTACAQNYPLRPVRIVVPYPPGGGTDIVARTIAQKLTDTLGQPVVVDNRAGANGIIGTDQATKAKPDGYTLLITIASHAINPTLYSKLPYDTLADLAPVSLLATYPFVITVHPSVPVKTVKEFIAFAKAHPNQLSYASSGNGSGPHLGMELFKTMAGIEMVHVPYKGAGAAMVDLVSGQVSVFLNNFLAGMPMIKAGKLRALAVTSPQRSNVMPALPTVAESGVPGYSVTGWYGMLVPAATPAPVVNVLHDAGARGERAARRRGESVEGEGRERAAVRRGRGTGGQHAATIRRPPKERNRQMGVRDQKGWRAR